MTQIDEFNLDKIDQEITDILLEHLVLANDNGQPYIQYTDVAVDKIITLIAAQIQEARLEEQNYHLDKLKTGKWKSYATEVTDRIKELEESK